MRKIFPGLLALVIQCTYTFGQLQTADADGATQAATLKKLSKKAKYGAFSMQSNIAFSTGKGVNGTPVVTATEDGKIEMVSLEKKTVVGYMLPYNQFVKLTD